MKKVILTAALFLSACAGQPLTQSQLNEINTPVACKDKADCDAKWSRTQAWVVNNTKWKIKIATDTIIQTEGPFDETDLAFTATKQIKTDGSGEIGIRAGCGNMFGFFPSPSEAILKFKAAMN